MHRAIHDAEILGAVALWVLAWSLAMILAADLTRKKETR